MRESERPSLRVLELLHRLARFYPEQRPLLPDVPQTCLIHPPAHVAGIRHRRIATGCQAQLRASDVALRPPAEKPVVMRYTARRRRPAPIRLRLRLHVESQAPREKKPVVKINLPLQSGIRLRSSMDDIG